jgi:hypothetical protein
MRLYRNKEKMKKNYSPEQKIKIQAAHAEHGMLPYHHALENLDPKIKKQISDHDRKNNLIGYALSVPVLSVIALGQPTDFFAKAIEVSSIVSFVIGQGILYGRLLGMGTEAGHASGIAKAIQKVEQMFNESVLESQPHRECVECFKEYVEALCGPVEHQNPAIAQNLTPVFA